MVLGRVGRAKIGLPNGSDWEFFTGSDGGLATSWTKNMMDAIPILSEPGRFGMGSAVYPQCRAKIFHDRVVSSGGGGKLDGAGTHTTWDFYDSPRPWGPWTRIGSYQSTPSGYYSPGVCPKFQTPCKVFVSTAGYWESPPDYHLTVVPLEIAT